MPSCQSYFNELAECIQASQCVKKEGQKPSKCLELLLQSKQEQKYQRYQEAAYKHLGVEIEEIKITETFAPVECASSHQTYTECKRVILDPRSRLNGPFGFTKKKKSTEE